jgi:hypothetical protein
MTDAKAQTLTAAQALEAVERYGLSLRSRPHMRRFQVHGFASNKPVWTANSDAVGTILDWVRRYGDGRCEWEGRDNAKADPDGDKWFGVKFRYASGVGSAKADPTPAQDNAKANPVSPAFWSALEDLQGRVRELEERERNLGEMLQQRFEELEQIDAKRFLEICEAKAMARDAFKQIGGHTHGV